jgi:hypothetical protein
MWRQRSMTRNLLIGPRSACERQVETHRRDGVAHKCISYGATEVMAGEGEMGG